MTTRSVFLFAIAFLLPASVRSDDDKKEAPRIQGTWSAAALLGDDGKPMAPTKELEDFIAWTWVFEDGKGVLHTRNGSQLGFTYKLDASQNPQALDLTWVEKGKPKNDKLLAIYQLNGDTLKFAFSRVRRPTKFKATWDDDWDCAFELVRQKPKVEKK